MSATPSARPRRERPKIVSLTEAAATRIGEIITAADGRYAGVRVGVTNGGCAGMSYVMDYAEGAGPLDEVIDDKGVKIFVDPKAVMFLLGTQLDFKKRSLRHALSSRIPIRPKPAVAANPSPSSPRRRTDFQSDYFCRMMSARRTERWAFNPACRRRSRRRPSGPSSRLWAEE